MKNLQGAVPANGRTVKFKDERDSMVFIHSELDDFGLTPEEFRVYCHIARRSNNGSAWPGLTSMSKICRMARRTVVNSIRSLEYYGMVRICRESGSCNVYSLTNKSCWENNQCKRDTGGGECILDTGGSANGTLGECKRDTGGSANGTLKGSPLKVIQLRSSIEGSPIVTKPHKFFDPFKNEIPEPFRTEPFMESLNQWHTYKKERKMGYKPTGAKILLSKLIQSGSPQSAIDMIQQAMANNWSGLFQTPKSPSANGNSKYGAAMRGNADRNQLYEKIEIKSL